ncbi:hypothetical protein F5X97DRAFT_176000 [Nemania serpens]|nr:hypothetical protein F5X97DRAFT_176000 [Nemania serpens]
MPLHVLVGMPSCLPPSTSVYPMPYITLSATCAVFRCEQIAGPGYSIRLLRIQDWGRHSIPVRSDKRNSCICRENLVARELALLPLQLSSSSSSSSSSGNMPQSRERQPYWANMISRAIAAAQRRNQTIADAGGAFVGDHILAYLDRGSTMFIICM